MSYHVHLVSKKTINVQIDGETKKVNVAYHGWDTRDQYKAPSNRKRGAHEAAWAGSDDRPQFVVMRYHDKKVSNGCPVYKVDRLISFWETPVDQDKDSKYLGEIKKVNGKWTIVPEGQGNK